MRVASTSLYINEYLVTPTKVAVIVREYLSVLFGVVLFLSYRTIFSNVSYRMIMSNVSYRTILLNISYHVIITILG